MKELPSIYCMPLLTGATLVFSFILILTACGGSTSRPSPQSHSIATKSSGTSSSKISTPAIMSGVQPCPNVVSEPSYWDPIIGTQSGVAKVESVICATLIGVPSLQVLVNVRYAGPGASLDVYIFNNITSANPPQLFKLQGLYKGDARISGYNTILTGEVDQGSSINSNQSNAALVQDLFREFKWFDGAGTFVQVSFPGIFPDLTRFQAEADQAQVNQGRQRWKLDAAMTANALAVNMLRWSTSAQATIVSGGGPHDLDAVVTVKSTNPGGGTISVTLSRLEGNANGGIWEATAVQAGATATITAPVNRDLLSSPITVTGNGNASEGKIGTVIVLDHLYNDIGHADAKGTIGNGNTTFSVNVTYQSTFHGGAEEGAVVLYAYDADGSIATAVMEKELLGA